MRRAEFGLRRTKSIGTSGEEKCAWPSGATLKQGLEPRFLSPVLRTPNAALRTLRSSKDDRSQAGENGGGGFGRGAGGGGQVEISHRGTRVAGRSAVAFDVIGLKQGFRELQ